MQKQLNIALKRYTVKRTQLDEVYAMTKKSTTGITVTRFDAADYLDSEEMIAEYLSATLEDSNPDVFLSALGDVAKARGMAKIAKMRD